MDKTPITLLQETLAKRGGVPTYQDITVKKNTHHNIFDVRVTYNGFDATGSASTKKQAKHNAAQQMMMILMQENVVRELPLPLVKPLDNANEVPEINYVGMLQERCMLMRCAPTYKDVSTTGPKQAPEFTVECVVDSLCCNGTGRTKKIAKKNAAQKVLQSISDQLKISGLKNLCDESPFKIAEPELLPSFHIETPVNVYRKMKSHVNYSHSLTNIRDYHLVLTTICSDVPLELIKSMLRVPETQLMYMEMDKYKKNISDVFKTNLQEITNIHIKSVKKFVFGFRILTDPVILEIGIGDTKEAAWQSVIFKLGRLMKLMKPECL